MDVQEEDFLNITDFVSSSADLLSNASSEESSSSSDSSVIDLNGCCVRTDLGSSLIGLFHFWVEGVSISVVGGFGLLGNILSISVLCNREMRSAFNQLLIVLSTVDSLLIVMAVFDYR